MEIEESCSEDDKYEPRSSPAVEENTEYKNDNIL